uniref:Secretoglobin family 1D member 1 n=1 Tax=Molossus molossus TaxID=27622 RepID=A0A7J8EU86_MOLMO|nr:secretoglobin family 1D member 1 [Molossus molossus]
MRLSLSVLLVTLALCCYEANAKVCPAALTNIRSFILDPKFLYDNLMTMFDFPEPLEKARLAVKTCFDNIAYERRLRVLLVVSGLWPSVDEEVTPAKQDAGPTECLGLTAQGTTHPLCPEGDKQDLQGDLDGPETVPPAWELPGDQSPHPVAHP